jgi:thiamine phosphate synthase YjbQ (UPF0047 family)
MSVVEQFALNTGIGGFSPITKQVQDAIVKSGVPDGLCMVFCPHTTY